MPRIQYIQHNFTAATRATIAEATKIIELYAAQGFKLTLRQLYYQFVSRDLIPNTLRSYKRIGKIVTDARNDGLLDWDAIEDHTRELRENPHWDSPRDIIEASAEDFRYDLWQSQIHRLEIWMEKDALVNVFLPTCEALDVPLLSCRGYTSASAMWLGGRRIRRHYLNGQVPVVLHFGDHDPSGIDMTRDIADRLSLYCGRAVTVERLALNMDQVEHYQPPPNPAKESDSRFAEYYAQFGAESWELDALEPHVIADLITTAVKSYREEDWWEDAIEKQDAARNLLTNLAENIDEDFDAATAGRSFDN